MEQATLALPVENQRGAGTQVDRRGTWGYCPLQLQGNSEVARAPTTAAPKSKETWVSDLWHWKKVKINVFLKKLNHKPMLIIQVCVLNSYPHVVHRNLGQGI